MAVNTCSDVDSAVNSGESTVEVCLLRLPSCCDEALAFLARSKALRSGRANLVRFGRASESSFSTEVTEFAAEKNLLTLFAPRV